MKFLRDLMSRKPKAVETIEPTPIEDLMPRKYKEAMAEQARAALATSPESEQRLADRAPTIKVLPKSTAESIPAPQEADPAQDHDAIMQNFQSRLSQSIAQEAQKPRANIWDLDQTATADDAPPADARPRRRRNATRVLGFDGNSADVVSMFDSAPTVQKAERTKFPVGWMLITEGPGRGECFTLEAGMSQIGRGEDQAIQLDFGDNAISRSNHAAIVYDPETHVFKLGHGGKKNIVRLNGEPVISNETLSAGDKIKIGETTLHFVPLCSAEFNWADDGRDTEENDNVAIA